MWPYVYYILAAFLLIISIILSVAIVSELRSGKANAKKETYDRKKDASKFWMTVFFQIAALVFFVYTALRMILTNRL